MIAMPTKGTARLLLAVAVVTTSAAAFQGPPPPPPQPAPVRDPRTENRPLPTGTASVSGTVIAAGSGVPARKARVTLSGSDVGPARNTVTDEQGRFTFSALPAGRYSLSASKPGHVGVSYGQSRPGRPGTPIQLEEGQKFAAHLQLARGAVLTGTVLDEDGETIPGTQVRALRFVLQNGQRTLQSSGTGSTDDRGIYRIFGLQPGDYVVCAMPRNRDVTEVDALRSEMEAVQRRLDAVAQTGEAQAAIAARLSAIQAAVSNLPDEAAAGYAPVYYPGTTASAQAAPVTIGAGEERSGLDFQLQRVPVARVEGVVVNPTGQPLQNVMVTLIDLGQTVPGVGNNSARADAEGRFRLANVPPGQYRLSARATIGGGRGSVRFEVSGPGGGRVGVSPRPTQAEALRLWASTDITVDGRNLTNVVLALQAGVSASGRVVFQGTSMQPPTDLTRLRVNVTPMELGPAREISAPVSGNVDTTGRFTINGITPGRYRLSASGAPQGWTLESAVVDGQDSLDFPFEVKVSQNVGAAVITFTDQRSELTGALVDARGQPAPGYTLILYAADQRYWMPQSRRIRTTRPATDGRFTFGSLPAGDYKIAPVVDAEPGAWFDPAFLQQLDAAALRVSIADGEKKVQNVRISGSG